jgi:hypothetical protein
VTTSDIATDLASSLLADCAVKYSLFPMTDSDPLTVSLYFVVMSPILMSQLLVLFLGSVKFFGLVSFLNWRTFDFWGGGV